MTSYTASEIQHMRNKVNDEIGGLFAMVDTDNNGYIEKEELLKLMQDEGF